MFTDLKQAKTQRARFVVSHRIDLEYRKGFDKQDRPAIMEIPHRKDLTADDKEVSMVQMNEQGLYYFLVGDVMVGSVREAEALLN